MAHDCLLAEVHVTDSPCIRYMGCTLLKDRREQGSRGEEGGQDNSMWLRFSGNTRTIGVLPSVCKVMSRAGSIATLGATGANKESKPTHPSFSLADFIVVLRHRGVLLD